MDGLKHLGCNVVQQFARFKKNLKYHASNLIDHARHEAALS